MVRWGKSGGKDALVRQEEGGGGLLDRKRGVGGKNGVKLGNGNGVVQLDFEEGLLERKGGLLDRKIGLLDWK